MSSTTLFLLRLNERKKPMPRPGSLRVLSPPGGSILMTSAPRSARIMPHVGPMIMCVNSMTRTPSRGRVMVSLMMNSSVERRRSGMGFGQSGEPQRAVKRFPFQPLCDLRAQRQQRGNVNSGFDAHVGEHESEVLARYVAARARRMRAAAYAG